MGLVYRPRQGQSGPLRAGADAVDPEARAVALAAHQRRELEIPPERAGLLGVEHGEAGLVAAEGVVQRALARVDDGVRDARAAEQELHALEGAAGCHEEDT